MNRNEHALTRFEFDDVPYAYQAGRDGIEILEHRDEWARATRVSH